MGPIFADDVPVVSTRMSFDERDLLIVFLVRHPGVFAEAKQVLTPAHFSESFEIIWSIVWRACVDLYDQYGMIPERQVLEVEALAKATDMGPELPETGLQEIRNLMAHVYGMDLASILGPWQVYGYDLLQRFLKERHWSDQVKSLVNAWGDSTLVDTPAFLQDVQNRLASVTGVTAKVTDDLIPERWEQTDFTLESTGLEFFDRAMGGGTAREEVYGLLGTYGSGKTMMACSLLAEAAKASYIRTQSSVKKVADHSAKVKEHEARVAALRSIGLEWVDERGVPLPAPDPIPPKYIPLEQVLYFTYETPPDDIRKRVIANLAQIKLDSLNRTPYRETMSTMESSVEGGPRRVPRHSYEFDKFGTNPFGEWERYQAISPMSRLIGIADMRGSRENPKAGSQFIQEINSEIDKRRRKTGMEVSVVIIDYALVCVRRYIKIKNWDEDKKMRHLLGGFGDDCRRLIAQPFNCCVWVLNQLSGAANKRGAGAKMSHADSAEATNFAENLWYAFCIGNKDKNNMVSLDVTKTRRSAGVPEPIILKLEGDMARFESVDDRFMVDSNTRRIVDRRVGGVVAPTETEHRRARPGQTFM